MAAGIQRADVFAAADALVKEGARPTIERVRQKIGRGSPNTVTPFLDDWFKGLGARLEASATTPRSAASSGPLIPSSVLALAQKTWEAAQREALQTLQAERDALIASRQRLEHERQAFSQDRERQASLWAELQNRVAQQDHQLRQAHVEAQARQSTFAQLVEDLRLSRQREQAVAGELSALQSQAQEERQQLMTQHSAAEKRLALEVDRAREAGKALSGQLASAQAEARRHADEAAQRQGVLRGQLDQAVHRASELERQAGELQGRLTEVQRSHDLAASQAASQLHRIDELLEELRALRELSAPKSTARRTRNRAGGG